VDAVLVPTRYGQGEEMSPNEQTFKKEPSKFILAIACVIFSFSLLFGTIFAYITRVWPILIICAGLGLTVLIFVMIDIFIRTPKYITVTPDNFIFIYRMEKTTVHEYLEIQWLNIWKGSQDMPPYSALKLVDKRIPPKSIGYDAGRAIKNAYITKHGRKPLNYDEYLIITHESRWYSVGPSE
jgi:hypothetical protein